MITLRQALTDAARQLAEDESLRATATRDAEHLLLHLLDLPRAALLAHPHRELTSHEHALYQRSLARRLRHEPIQYITGQQEFYGLPLHVTPAVLIPRPETEHLVEAVLHLLPAGQPLTIADIGTGSGAIALALAAHLPQAQVIAFDLSPEALEVARANAASHHMQHRIQFLHSDLLAAVLPKAPAGEAVFFDAIVSNPPYIPLSDRDTLHPQVRDHEPSAALFAGASGLDIYRRLIPQALLALKPNGLLALEMGYGQRDALAHLLSGWDHVSFVDDLRQIPRVALARRPTRPAKR
jgi:release factor glutamine methyltransferase